MGAFPLYEEWKSRLQVATVTLPSPHSHLDHSPDSTLHHLAAVCQLLQEPWLNLSTSTHSWPLISCVRRLFFLPPWCSGWFRVEVEESAMTPAAIATLLPGKVPGATRTLVSGPGDCGEGERNCPHLWWWRTRHLYFSLLFIFSNQYFNLIICLFFQHFPQFPLKPSRNLPNSVCGCEIGGINVFLYLLKSVSCY